MGLNTYAVKEIEALKVLGRTTACREPLTLFWTGSGIECNVTGSELWIEIAGDYEIYEPWMSIVINGEYISRQMINKGKQWVCLFRGMNVASIKNVRVLKEVQAMSEDDAHCMQILSFKTDGEFLPVEEKKYKFEFIGDSITSGEGSMGAVQEEDWVSMWFSTQNNYARFVSDAMEAEYRILSKSGWGVYCSWDNNPYFNLPSYYEQICGVVKGKKNEALGALDAYDFKTWQPDVVIINLGTNDGGAFNSPEWKDETTGMTYKQRLNEEGSYNKEDLARFKEAVYQFLIKVRKNNPASHILWVYGMLGNPMLGYIRETVEKYKRDYDDRNADVLELPDTTADTVGARMHPGRASHERAAQVIVKYLKERLDRAYF